MPDEKNFFAGFVDFSFQQQLMRRLVKVLYIIGILGGLICFVTYVVLGSQQSPAEGLINFGVGAACSSCLSSFSALRKVLTALRTPEKSPAR